MAKQLGPSAVTTPTLKHDRHFLLVDDEVGLEEDAENDPGDLWREREENKCEKSSGLSEMLQRRRATSGRWSFSSEFSSQSRPVGASRTPQASFRDSNSTLLQ